MGLNTAGRVSKHRAGLRASGLRPVQLWVPDTRAPEFAVECQRQSALVADADLADHALMEFMDAALLDLDDNAG
jgi:Protein  of unknown function (DUF3018)